MINNLRSKSEIEEMVKENMNLVWYVIRENGIDTLDDNFQIGCIGLFNACRTYDTSKGIKFSSYAQACIMNELKMEFRRRTSKNNSLHNNALRLEYLLGDDTNLDFGDMYALSKEDDDIDKLLILESIKNVVRKINTKERVKNAVVEILTIDIIYGRSYPGLISDICKKNNVSRTSLMRYRRLVLDELKKNYKKL